MTTPIALITGGSRGLGKSMAIHLAKAGTDVVLTYRSKKDEAENVVREIEKLGRKAVALSLDTSKTGSFADFAGHLSTELKRKFGRDRFDFLVNNAGVGAYAPFLETTEAQFDEMSNVHLKGVFFLTQKLVPLMNDGGRILNVSSGLTRFSFPGYSAYATMKGAIETFTHYLAKELGPRGISANTIAPGAIETDFGGGRVRDDAELNAMIAGMTALGRVGLPDDVGAAVASILTSSNNWINAQRIEVSGGTLI